MFYHKIIIFIMSFSLLVRKSHMYEQILLFLWQEYSSTFNGSLSCNFCTLATENKFPSLKRYKIKQHFSVSFSQILKCEDRHFTKWIARNSRHIQGNWAYTSLEDTEKWYLEWQWEKLQHGLWKFEKCHFTEYFFSRGIFFYCDCIL